LLQLLPLVFILLSSILMNFRGEEEQIFSLQQMKAFVVPRQTNRLRLQYYVEHDFLQKRVKTQADIAKVDNDVEETHLYNLKKQCDTKQYEKDRYLAYARMSYSSGERQKLQNKANDVDISSCNEFNRLATSMGYYNTRGRW